MKSGFAILPVMLLSACASTPCPAPAAPPPASPAAPAEVRAFDAAPLKTSPNGKSTVRLLAQGQNAFLGKLEMQPADEYIHVISGHGTLTMDGKEYAIEPGTTIYMPAHVKVSYQNGDEPLVAIQVFAGPGPAAKYDAWK